MCKAIKEKFKDDQFSFNPFTEKEVINFISKLPTNKPSVSNNTLVLFQNSQCIFIAQSLQFERLFKKQNVS